MSFVLNALRRAEAERARGTVPNLHVATGLASQGRETRQRPATGPLWVAGLAVLLLLGVLAGWLWMRSHAPAAAPATPPVAAVAAPPPTEPAPAVAPSPPPILIRVEAQPARPAPVAAAPAQAPVLKLQALPDALRRQLPPLQFGGAMDSPVAAQRMVIVNGRVSREGDEVAAGVVLERISLRAAVIRFQGQRIELVF